MISLKVGYLFEKKYITYQDEKYEVFEFIDYVSCICFKNTQNNNVCNILTGSKAGEYASFINKDANENEDVFLADDIHKAIKDNDNFVNFIKIRENKVANTAKYYLRDEIGTGLTKLLNNDLLTYLQKMQVKDQSDFDENEFKKNTDIFSIYIDIKKTIISQDEQIMQILTSLFKNQKVVNSSLGIDLITKLKENILIYGPNGTGKKEILKRISKLCGIPIIVEDVTLLFQNGNEGRKITDVLEDLYLEANQNSSLAEKGILVIDKFDKLALKPDDASNISRLNTQRALLKLFEGNKFYLGDKKIDTSKLTIIGVGNFIEIYNGDYNLTTDDFIKYGIMRELIGKFSKTISMNLLKKEDIIKILKESDLSLLNAYKKLFEILKVDFLYNDEFIEYIAKLALTKQDGARSLKTVFDDCISSALFKIFAGEYSSISLVKPDFENDKPYILTKK